MFRRNMSLPSSRMKSQPIKKPGIKQNSAAYFMLDFCWVYSSTLKIEAAFSFETIVDFQWTIWHYIPEDRTVHTQFYENLKSYKM
jgi:hypothetical protein